MNDILLRKKWRKRFFYDSFEVEYFASNSIILKLNLIFVNVNELFLMQILLILLYFISIQIM